jgi:hypothetical protein
MREGVDGCYLSGLSGTAHKTLEGLNVLAKLPENHVFESRIDAIRAAVQNPCGFPLPDGALGRGFRRKRNPAG